MIKKLSRKILLALMLTLVAMTAHAQAKAQLPYSMVASYQELFKSLAQLDQVIPSIGIVSTNPRVTPESITFKIKIDDGWESFSPDKNGDIQFPDRPDWADLTLISDQPKGTLQLVIGFRARQLSSTSTSYQELMGLVPQFEEALTALAKLQGQSAPDIKGLSIQLPEGSGATVNILSQKRKTTLKSSSAGLVIMKYNKALWTENPPVEFDEIPIGIVPLQ
jgi:hypothetical protein